MDGKVWLVGAGPGDPDLITVRGRHALAYADVVVYDWKVPGEFLDHVAEGAEVVYAGPQPGMHDITEEEIDELLVRKAREGKRVVRLFGGDPFVFGRGAEEAEALHTAGVPYEVVNGVTSSVAAPAYAGIPVTYSGVASSFAVIEGREDPDAPASPYNWAKLATAVDTLVLVAAVDNLARISAALLRHGRPASTPAAVVGWGAYARQETITGTLENIAEKVAHSGLQPPAVIVVGEVVRLRERLRWYEDRPLFGKRVLITRSRRQAPALRRLLREEGAQVLELPALEIVETTAPEIIERVVAALADGQYAWAVFTSANAVDLFFRHLEACGRDARVFGTSKICAIGTEAADALARRSIRPDVVRDESEADEAAGILASKGIGRRRILLPRAGTTRKELIAALRKHGAEVEEIPLYVMAIPRQPDRESLGYLRRSEVDIVTFANSTAVTNLAGMLGGETGCLRDATIACIGRQTAQAVRDLGLRADVVTEGDRVTDLVAALRAHYMVRA